MINQFILGTAVRDENGKYLGTLEAVEGRLCQKHLLQEKKRQIYN